MFRGNSFGAARIIRTFAIAATLTATLSGCYQKMGIAQPAFDPYQPSDFFDDKSSARPMVEGTIPHGMLRDDDFLYTGKVGGQYVTSFPFPITKDVLDRGEQRFNIYCSMCHGRTGEGDGMIVRRGYKKPPSYHSVDIVSQPNGFYFETITNGFGVMPPYAPQVPVEDRWAIVAYIRALQLSQSATVADIPPDELSKLEAGGSK
jgi:mono/diheme cytochrome c family protein